MNQPYLLLKLTVGEECLLSLEPLLCLSCVVGVRHFEHLLVQDALHFRCLDDAAHRVFESAFGPYLLLKCLRSV